jgi:hypothetical protein
MAHPQSSPRGLFAKQRIDVGSSQLTYNSTALILNNGIKISNAQTLTGNTTGVIFSDVLGALPGNVNNSALIGMLTNSTGHALVIATTGTTLKYLNVTSVLPT